MSELERRFTPGAVEVRAAKPRVIGGYAAKFNKTSRNLGGFVEQIAPDFFNKSAGDGWPNVMARYNHEDLLGTTSAESLRISVDDTGLVYEVDMLTDSVSERVLQLVTRGDVQKSSFAFYTFEDDWAMTEDGFPLRTLVSGQLVDVAPVDDPAYLDTSTGLRSLAEQRNVDIEEVRKLAADNELVRLLKASPTVIDLGGSADTGQGDTHPSGRVQALLRALEMNKKH